MSIKTETVNLVIEKAGELLQKKTLGGVTTESANNAIKRAAHDVEDIGNKEIAKLRIQLNAEQSASHKNIADLTTQKDKAEFNLEQTKTKLEKAEEELKSVTENYKRAVETKYGKPKLLSNGNYQVSKVNKNGARMTVEYLPNEAKTPLSYTVEDIDGKVRNTTLNPVTGRPIKTYTDTNGEKGTGHIYEYLPNGTRIKKVNVKNENVKPQFVSRQILSEDRDFAKLQKNYSDGSYEIIDYNKYTQTVTQSQRFNNEQKLISEYKESTVGNGIPVKYETLYNPVTGNKTKMVSIVGGDEVVEKKALYYADDGKTVIKSDRTLMDGTRRIAKAKIDDNGFIDTQHPDITFVYPKESPIKTGKFGFNREFLIKKESLKLKDGRLVELDINDTYYAPTRAVVKQGKTITEISDRKELKEFLEQIGYRKGLSEDYTNTYI